MSHIKISEIKINPANPRVIKDERFYKLVRSIAHFPAMLSKRGIVVDKNRMSLGGNQRKRGIEHILTMSDADFQKLMESRQDLIPFWDGLRQKKSIPENWVVDGSDFTEDEIRRFVIADNVSFGELDMDALANEWDAEELQEWGLDLPVFDIEPDDLIGQAKNKDATLKITFPTPEDLQMCESEIQEVINRLCPKAFYSVSAGEV
jgi:hypothetical protein